MTSDDWIVTQINKLRISGLIVQHNTESGDGLEDDLNEEIEDWDDHGGIFSDFVDEDEGDTVTVRLILMPLTNID